MSELEWQTKPALRHWVRYAADLIHPKTTRSSYPVLDEWSELQDYARDLVKASEAGASTSTQWAIADQMNTVLQDIQIARHDKGASR
ncbi:hypothetical protein [Deinococcus sp. Leaf326]|uniref:hypothetical protein n=1 Tax=Deinococcus sp. Leaf326 TaxID=1736338 RepID=UPI0006F8CF95|nr:hypothetical protein [Deinococcus sp. Leaf326]KQR40782.1 hypothetical protein ASF71_01030 [Deinococcus sp. Leaf326]